MPTSLLSSLPTHRAGAPGISMAAITLQLSLAGLCSQDMVPGALGLHGHRCGHSWWQE